MDQKERAKQDRREHREWADRLVRLWADVPADVREQGADWYPNAERAAARLAKFAPSGVGPARAAAVVAALSPRTRWAGNIATAEQAIRAAARADADSAGADLFGFSRAEWIEGAVMHATESHGLRDPRSKACRILAGGRPTDVLGGPKVRAFYRNITGDERAVTVDVWAYRAAQGAKVPGAFSERVYHRIAAAYRAAADAVGVAPRDFQAAIWIHVRGKAD